MRIAVVLLGVGALVALISPAADAQLMQYQTTFQIRYWSAGFGCGTGASIAATDSASTWGGTIRLDSRNSPWSFSGRYDAMSISSGGTCGRTSQSLWDVNVHYRFGPSLDSYIGVFAGWGGLSQGSPSGLFNGSTSGPRIGLEAFSRLQGGWYVTGEAAYGPSWNSNYSNFPNLAAGNTQDYRAAVGYEFSGGYGVEVGWRLYNWKIPSSPGCSGGCNFQFSGVTAALTFRR